MAALPFQQQLLLKKFLEASVPDIESQVMAASKADWARYVYRSMCTLYTVCNYHAHCLLSLFIVITASPPFPAAMSHLAIVTASIPLNLFKLPRHMWTRRAWRRRTQWLSKQRKKRLFPRFRMHLKAYPWLLLL